MKVFISMGWEKAVADLSGQELETLTRLVGKLQLVERQHLNGRYMHVLKDEPKLNWSFEVGGDAEAPAISKAIAVTLRDNDLQKNRATMVAKVLETPDFDTVEKLKKQLYYDNVFTKDQFEQSYYESGSQEHGVVDFFVGDTCYRVNADGTTEEHNTAK